MNLVPNPVWARNTLVKIERVTLSFRQHEYMVQTSNSVLFNLSFILYLCNFRIHYPEFTLNTTPYCKLKTHMFVSKIEVNHAKHII